MKLPKFLAWPELIIGSVILLIGFAMISTKQVSCIFFCAQMAVSFLTVWAGAFVLLFGMLLLAAGVIRTIIQFVKVRNAAKKAPAN